MRCLFCTVLVILLAVVVAPSVFAQDFEIPSWIKNNAGWWADGQIDDNTFVSGLQWLISNDVMIIPPTEQGAGSDNVIPGWIKNNAGWWADGQIDDSSFVSGIQWLISNGIIMLEETHSVTEFRVAFIGDQGHGPGSFSVLELIKDEKAQMVLHQGDLDYGDDPDKWDRMISNVLGDDFPYFASVGEHDAKAWYEGPIRDGYQDKLYDRLKKNPEITCVGDLGVKSACTYNDLFFILVSPAAKGSGHDSFIENQLNNNNSVWSVCSWAKNMNKMQMGSKKDQTGWEVYNACKNGGAIIATGHEHSYHRTKTLIDIENQIVDPQWSEPNNLIVKEGSTFVFVSGLGGHSIRDQARCLPDSYPYGCNHEWANIYTSDQDANFGALFCTFNAGGQPNEASCYFKNIDGKIIDVFGVTSLVSTDITNTNPTNTELPERDSIEVDLSKTILRGADLAEANLAGVDLSGKDLTYANLSSQDLSGHDLTDTILRGADLSNSVLPDDALSIKNFENAILNGVDLSGKDLSLSNFRYADFDDTNLENTNLEAAEFMVADLTKIKNKSLVNADLRYATFPFSNLSGINLAGTTLYRVNFHDSNLTGVDFTDINNKQLVGGIFISSDLSNSNFEGINFDYYDKFEVWFPGDAHLIDVVQLGFYNEAFAEYHPFNPNRLVLDKYVDGNDLKIAFIFINNFADSNLQNVNFSNAILSFSILDRANLANANFSNADLTGSTFQNSNLANANFSNADLTGSNFQNANLAGAVFDGAILDDAILDCKNHPVCNN